MKRKSVFLLVLFFAMGNMIMNACIADEKESLPSAPRLKWTDRAEELGLDAKSLEPAWAALVKAAKENKVAGSVGVMGRNGYALKPFAAGHAVLQPEKIAMSPDTIFDLASITKMVATNTSIMILIEDGKIRLDDYVVKYLPEFAAKGKDKITIRHLLTHTSGLPPFKQYYKTLKGRSAFYKAVCDEAPANALGTNRIYSDIGFMTLGFIVEKVSGKDLNEFTQERIFKPLNMKHTRFNPPASWKKRIAATEFWSHWNRLAWGEVHDENANAIGGIAGHAGLFSTAGDLAIFCQMLLNGGKYGNIRILQPQTIRQFYTLQTKPEISKHQGMGWILGSTETDGTGGLGPDSFGHSGFTGTLIWINPKYQTFGILLTNAIHTDRKNAQRAYVRNPFFKALLQSMNATTASPESLQKLHPVDSYWVESVLRRLTLDEKVGQMIVPTYHNDDTLAFELLRQIKPAGFIASRGVTVMNLAERINKLQAASDLPLLMTADFERGVGCYFDGATDLPSNMALGASKNASDTKEAARITAIEGRAIGVHLNFAPVLDVNNNPDNPIINTRSFGENPKEVARLGEVWIRTSEKYGLLSTGKHFPGHGNTSVDSHSSMGMVSGNEEQLWNIELLPFQKAIKNAKVSSIMTAHLWVPTFDAKPVPATLSKNVMTDLLRNKMKFEGLLFTDAMDMSGAANGITFEESIIRAVEAGCDVILMPGDAVKSWEAILKAVKDGRIKEDRIDNSVRKILAAKTRVNLQKERFVNLDNIKNYVGTKENYDKAKQIAQNSLTLISDAPEALPLLTKKSTAVIMMANQADTIMDWKDIYTFGKEAIKLNPNTRVLFMVDDISEEDKEKAEQLAQECDQVVFALFPHIIIGRGNVSLNAEQRELLNHLMSLRLPRTIISFGSPYVIDETPGAPSYICAYGNAAAVQSAAAYALFHNIEWKGSLPVSLKKQ
ncbi:MAG TPA: glycoside hydrolase family 3 N-terminal domain-containing protein [Candidatus Sumerlaeota bacterium]|nr:glycoside hydrolase family 3 N-terminal domain-containing protein [Candidatus Sumerlaeota bacterium]